MQDLNDLSFFAAVVTHGGFAAAGRALGMPKSKLSRRVSQLEARLGIRLIERSSRRFRVTDTGRDFYERCLSMLNEAEAAEAVAIGAQGEPRGLVRFSCPTGLIEPLTESLNAYARANPLVRLQIVATDRRVDLIGERIDVALRVRTSLDNDAAITVRTIGRSRRILLASPTLAETLASTTDIAALAHMPTLSTNEATVPAQWELTGPDGQAHSLRHEPRLACADFVMVRAAAIVGLGVALLPDHACWTAIEDGRLVRLFPEWFAQEGIVHLAFTARRGLPPAVRALIDHLALHFRSDEQAARKAGTPALTLRNGLRRL